MTKIPVEKGGHEFGASQGTTRMAALGRMHHAKDISLNLWNDGLQLIFLGQGHGI
jgi:hypothetical protein